MNEDIVPGLLANIEDDFKKSFQSDDTLKTLYGKVQGGTATQADGEKFSHELGRLTAEVFHRNVTPEILPDGTLYYNIANRIIPPVLGNNHDIVCEVMKQVIERMNHDAGLGIKFQEPEFEFRRVHDLVWKASLDKYEKTQKMVETGLDTFTRSVADDCVRTNAEFQYEAGLSPRIERDTDGDCCSWCSDMAGTYDYKSAPKEVFARHANCGCTVEFLPGDGRRQNVHTKDWTSETESAMMNSEGFKDVDMSSEKLEALKMIGLRSGPGDDALVQPHDPPQFVTKVDPSDKATIKKLIDDFEKEAVSLPVENALVITKTGEVYRCFGVEDAVYPNYDLGDKLIESIVTHNHPESVTEYSFSVDDRCLFFDSRLSLLRGVDHLYTYEMDHDLSHTDSYSETDDPFTSFRHLCTIMDAEKLHFGYRRVRNDERRGSEKGEGAPR